MSDPTLPIGEPIGPGGPPPSAAAPPVPPTGAGQHGGARPAQWAGGAAGGHELQKRSWFARHKILTVMGGVLGLVFILGGIGAAVGDPSTDKEPSPVAAGATSSTAAAVSLPPSSAPPAPAGEATAITGSGSSAQPAETRPADTVAVPRVVGQRLDAATAVLSAAELGNVTPTDGTGQDRVVLNPANWVVTGQKPAAGTRVSPSQPVTLTVVKPSDTSAGGTVQAGTVPDVVCKDLQAAQDTLQSAGFYNLGSKDGTGQGRAQLIDRNWVVIAQSAPAGSSPGLTARIVLTAVKYGEPTGNSGCPS